MPPVRLEPETLHLSALQLTGLQIRLRTGKLFSYFSTKTYVVGNQKNCLKLEIGVLATGATEDVDSLTVIGFMRIIVLFRLLYSVPASLK